MHLQIKRMCSILIRYISRSASYGIWYGRCDFYVRSLFGEEASTMAVTPGAARGAAIPRISHRTTTNTQQPIQHYEEPVEIYLYGKQQH